MRLLRIEIAKTETAALAAHLQRYGCRVLVRDGRLLEIEFPQAETDREALSEAALYLSFWGGRGRVCPPGRARPLSVICR